MRVTRGLQLKSEKNENILLYLKAKPVLKSFQNLIETFRLGCRTTCKRKIYDQTEPYAQVHRLQDHL